MWKVNELDGTLTDQSYSTVSLVFKKFLAEENKIIKNSSFRIKKNHIENFVTWASDCDISKVDKKIVGYYFASILQNKDSSSSTIRNIVSNVGSLFRWAEGRVYLEYNSFSNTKLPKKIGDLKIGNLGLMKILWHS